MNIRNRDIPGVVWVLLLVVGVYLLEHFLPGNYMAEGVLGVVGAMLVVLKMGLTMEEKRLVGEFEEGLKSEPERMSAPARRLYDVEVKSGSIRKLLLG